MPTSLNRNCCPNKKLGKLEPRIDHRTLKLKNYLMPPLPTLPDSDGYIDKVGEHSFIRWPMYGNDTIGDCTTAAVGHMIQQWTAYAETETVIPLSAVLAAYEKVSGYVPGKPETDNGAAMLDVLNLWRNNGIGGHTIKAFVSVDYKNRKEVEQAQVLFGNVYIGLGMPLMAMNDVNPHGGNPLWQINLKNGDSAPWSWGGHAVPIVGYRDTDNLKAGHRAGLTVVSWGQLFDMTWAFFEAYAEEAWAVLSMDWLNREGNSPTGLNLAQLEADLAQIV